MSEDTFGCGNASARPVATLRAWAEAWRFVTAVSTARVHNIDVDQDALLADYDYRDVVAVLTEFVGRVLDVLDPADAAAVCMGWGAIAGWEAPYGPRR